MPGDVRCCSQWLDRCASLFESGVCCDWDSVSSLDANSFLLYPSLIKLMWLVRWTLYVGLKSRTNYNHVWLSYVHLWVGYDSETIYCAHWRKWLDYWNKHYIEILPLQVALSFYCEEPTGSVSDCQLQISSLPPLGVLSLPVLQQQFASVYYSESQPAAVRPSTTVSFRLHFTVKLHFLSSDWKTWCTKRFDYIRIPDSINRSANFKSCWVKTNSIAVVTLTDSKSLEPISVHHEHGVCLSVCPMMKLYFI